MPDPVLYTQAMFVAAIVSTLSVLTMGWAGRLVTARAINGITLVGLVSGLCAGYRVLQLRVSWPPANGLSRLLSIVLPLVFLVELVGLWSRVAPWGRWCFRLALILSVPRILLHDSVYLRGADGQWTPPQALALLLISSLSLATVWWLLTILANHSPGSVSLALALACQTTALTVMLAGYVSGGAAALPVTASLVATSLAASLLTRHRAFEGMIGVGTVLLFGLLFVGRFFGGLSTPQALTIFTAPLLCWVSEIPALRKRSSWQVAALQITVVLVPLAIVVVLAKHNFDRHTAPLLSTTMSCSACRDTPLNFLCR